MSQINLIDVENSNPQIPTSFVTDLGTAIPLINTLELLGGTDITTTGSGNTITIDYTGASGGAVDSVSGTLNRITITGTASDPIVDIASTYVGQTSLITLGTVTTGTWQASVITEVYGGTAQSSYTTGDILYASAGNILSKLAAGSDTEVLTLSGGVPSWAAPATSGDVVGPASATDNAIARYDGTTGKLIQNSVVIVDDVGVVTGVTDLTVDSINIYGDVITTLGATKLQIIGTQASATAIDITTSNAAGGIRLASSVNIQLQSSLGEITLSPQLSEAYGGTNQTNYATGDILYASASNTLSKLAAGSDSQVLTLASGVPSWAAPAGGGDVVGPASATDNAIARYDLTTGKLIQNSVPTIDDTGNLSITAAVSGGSLSSTVANTSNTASATAFYNAQVAGSSAGDTYTRYGIVSNNYWSTGIDNSDSDSFKINWATTGVSPSDGVNYWKMTTAGERTMPLQPSFLSYLGTTDSNVTGNATVFTLGSGNALTEVYDQGGDFVTTGTFTSPVVGIYDIKVKLYIIGGSTSTGGQMIMITSNRNYRMNLLANQYSGNYNFYNNASADMDSADTFTTTISVSGEGSDIVDISGASSNTQTFMSASLIH